MLQVLPICLMLQPFLTVLIETKVGNKCVFIIIQLKHLKGVN